MMTAGKLSQEKNTYKRIALSVPRGGAGLGDYTGAASDLFNNMRAPAALVGGSIVPMGFAATPEPNANDSKFIKRLKLLHMIIAILSLSSEIIAVTYSTVAINKLSESIIAPTTSVTALLKRDFELQWLGCNVNFLLGLLGFASMLGIRAWIVFGPKIGKISILAVGSVISHCLSVINHGISYGDGSGSGSGTFGSNFFGIIKRYFHLTTSETLKNKGILQFAAFGFLAASLYFYSKTSPDDTSVQ